jgi:hypothetical protein
MRIYECLGLKMMNERHFKKVMLAKRMKRDIIEEKLLCRKEIVTVRSSLLKLII